MSNSDEEKSDLGIDDEQLPEDLQPSEDNPLAEGLDDGETVDDLLDGGKGAEEGDDDDDSASDADDSDDSDTEDGSGES